MIVNAGGDKNACKLQTNKNISSCESTIPETFTTLLSKMTLYLTINHLML